MCVLCDQVRGDPLEPGGWRSLMLHMISSVFKNNSVGNHCDIVNSISPFLLLNSHITAFVSMES